MALKKPCNTCPFKRSANTELSFDSVMTIEYNIRSHNGHVPCSEDGSTLCAGSHSVALKEDIAKESVIYRFQAKKLGIKATKALKNNKSTWASFEEFALHQEHIDEEDS